MSPHPLVLLHHAGGSASFFEPLVKALPAAVRPIPVELPGRGRRWRESPVTTIDDAVDTLVATLRDHEDLQGEFAILGHSLGAYLGLALAARLEETAPRSRCTTLFASANAAPRAAVLPFTGSALLTTEEEIFDITSKSGGGVAPQILEHDHLRQRAADLLRADFSVSQSFLTKLRRTVTEADLVVCYGSDDIFPEEQLTPWRFSSTQQTEFHAFPGGHFYLEQSVPELAELITERLTSAAS